MGKLRRWDEDDDYYRDPPDPPERDPEDFRCHECEAPLPIARIAGSRLCDDCRDERERRYPSGYRDEGGEA